MINLLKHRLSSPLPGKKAQVELASGRSHMFGHRPTNHRLSGVLILLYPHLGQWHTVFMKRTEDGRTHSGQISFPGGRKEESDPDLYYTALREAHEELGIVPEEVEILGRLTDLYIPSSNYLVVPTVGIVQTKPSFVPNPTEVAAIVESPLPTLMDPANKVYAEVFGSSGFHMEVPAFKVGEHIIWGATAMILNELLVLFKDL
ncbi:MAG: CoA pyrophosphatase [Bacteroidota bacterium]